MFCVCVGAWECDRVGVMCDWWENECIMNFTIGWACLWKLCFVCFDIFTLFLLYGIPILCARHYNRFWKSLSKNTVHCSCLSVTGYSLRLNDALLSLGLSGAFSLLSFWQDWLFKLAIVVCLKLHLYLLIFSELPCSLLWVESICWY